MKTLFRILFLVLPPVSFCNAQWTQLATGSYGELRSTYFRDSQTGYIAGSDSFILKTTDAGANWTFKYTGSTDTLRCVYFTDDTTGYAVGAQGTILKSTDAGDSWQPQVSGNTNLLRSVHFPSHDLGYIAGGGGVILKTTDGGANWIPQASGTTQDLISIRFINNDTGYCVSSLPTFYSGLILKTTNGGANWDTVYTHADGFLSVFPVNNDTIYAVGGFGVIVRSADGGNTWTVQASSTANNLRAVFFLTADTGYASGDLGDLLFTADAGATWTNQSIQTAGLLGLYFPMHDTGYVVGTAGVLLRYSKPCALAPSPVQIFGGTTVCEGSVWTYYINPVPGATSYTWTAPPGALINSGQGDTLVSVTFGNSPGNLSVTADNLCGQSVPWNLTISVNAAPPPPVISAFGNSLQSTTSNAYQWYLNGNILGGATSSSYVPIQNGTYTVVVTNAFGCTAVSAPFTVINAGIADPAGEEPVVFPQPFGKEVIFSWPASSVMLPKQITITDLQGRIYLRMDLLPGIKNHMNTELLSNGIYFYEVRSDQQVIYRGKLMKQ